MQLACKSKRKDAKRPVASPLVLGKVYTENCTVIQTESVYAAV